MQVKSKSGRVFKLPTPKEDAAITAAALSDPDAVPLTDAQWEAARPFIRRGRPPAPVTKERITIRVSRDVVERFRTSGDGWQTRVDAALKDWLKDHRPA